MAGNNSNGNNSNGSGDKPQEKSLLRKILGGGMKGQAADAATRRERRRQWMMRNPSKDPEKYRDEWE